MIAGVYGVSSVTEFLCFHVPFSFSRTVFMSVKSECFNVKSVSFSDSPVFTPFYCFLSFSVFSSVFRAGEISRIQ